MTAPTIAHTLIDNHNNYDEPTKPETIRTIGTTLRAMHARGEDTEGAFDKMQDHPSHLWRAEWAKSHPQEARNLSSYVNDPHPEVQEAQQWDNPDKLLHGTRQARMRAAVIGNESHHKVLMNDPEEKVQANVAKHASPEIKAEMWVKHGTNYGHPVQRALYNSSSAEYINALANRPEVHARQHAAYKGAHLPEISRKLVKDPAPEVRYHAIRDTTDKKTLEYAAQHDPDHAELAQRRLRDSAWMLRDNPGEV